VVNNIEIGERLRAIRGERSAEAISVDMGVSKSAWCMYERGERIPRDEVKKRISEYSGKSVQELFYD